MTITVRAATAGDYPAVEALAAEILAQHVAALPDVFQMTDPGLDEEFYTYTLTDRRCAVFVAEEAGEIVGYAQCRVRYPSDIPMLVPRIGATIETLVVRAARRGRGIGRALFAACRAWADSRGAETLDLLVWEFNAEAIAFYQRLGMTTLNRTMAQRLTGGM